MNEVTMTRVVNERMRYLKLSISSTLFSDLLIVESLYGAVRNKKPTGANQKYFSNLHDAKNYLKSYINSKLKKGYRCSDISIEI